VLSFPPGPRVNLKVPSFEARHGSVRVDNPHRGVSNATDSLLGVQPNSNTRPYNRANTFIDIPGEQIQPTYRLTKNQDGQWDRSETYSFTPEAVAKLPTRVQLNSTGVNTNTAALNPSLLADPRLAQSTHLRASAGSGNTLQETVASSSRAPNLFKTTPPAVPNPGPITHVDRDKMGRVEGAGINDMSDWASLSRTDSYAFFNLPDQFGSRSRSK